MVTATVRLNVDGFKRLRARAPQAIVRATNRAAVSARAAMVPLMARDLGIKQGALVSGFSTTYPGLKLRNATLALMIARLAAPLRRIPLIHFGAKGPEPSRGKGSGVTYRLGGSRGQARSGFIATMRSGHRGVFVRGGKSRVTTRTRTVARRPRLPIRELFGPSLGRVFLKYRPQGRMAALTSLVKNIQSEFKYALSRS